MNLDIRIILNISKNCKWLSSVSFELQHILIDTSDKQKPTQPNTVAIVRHLKANLRFRNVYLRYRWWIWWICIHSRPDDTQYAKTIVAILQVTSRRVKSRCKRRLFISNANMTHTSERSERLPSTATESV